MESITSANNILVISDQKDAVTAYAESLKTKTKGQITTKSIQELSSDCPASNYDFIISGLDSNYGLEHSPVLLSIILKVAQPNATIVLRQLSSSQSEFTSLLKISGFVHVSESTKVSLTSDEIKILQEKLNTKNDITVLDVSCSKPSFEIGSSAKLSFAAKKAEPAAAVWKIDSGLDDDEDETIDPDTLLDEDDLKKPDPSSLRVCGTTGKRKACKDCSCGLAEELESEGKPKPDLSNAPKSSCGSCYLGDAFRCASCPYLGMPAFKPGEKIQLVGNQLQADL